MPNTARQTRNNRTITVDFYNEATYFQLLDDGKAFVECVLAFLLALGFQLAHKATCRDSGCLTRHSHYARVRLGGLTIWRIQCITCKAVFTVLPHFVLRYRSMRPEVARDARKTLRLPRCLRRGGMSIFGSGLDARCQIQVEGSTMAAWSADAHHMPSTIPCTTWSGRPSTGETSCKAKSNSGSGI